MSCYHLRPVTGIPLSKGVLGVDRAGVDRDMHLPRIFYMHAKRLTGY